MQKIGRQKKDRERNNQPGLFHKAPLLSIGFAYGRRGRRDQSGILRGYFTESARAAITPGVPTCGISMSSLRMTMVVAFRLASSKPWPCVIASVGHASTQYPQKMQRL